MCNNVTHEWMCSQMLFQHIGALLSIYYEQLLLLFNIGILYIGYYNAWYIATENESPIEVSKLIITRYNSTIIIILMIIIQYYTITTHLLVCFNNLFFHREELKRKRTLFKVP